MKELETGLTNAVPKLTLRVEGNFMADGPKSIENPTPQSEAAKAVTPEKIAVAKIAWAKHNKGRVVGVDEQRVIDEIVGRGIGPEEVTPEQVEKAREEWSQVKVQIENGNEQQEIEELIKKGVGPWDYFKYYGPDARTMAAGGRAGPGAMIMPPPLPPTGGMTPGGLHLPPGAGGPPPGPPGGPPTPPAGPGGPVPPGPPTAESVFEGLVYKEFRPEEKVLFLSDRNARNAFFNKFFDLVNATPHEEFRSVFSADFVKSSGYQSFMDIIESASLGRFGTVQTEVEQALQLANPGVPLPNLLDQLKDQLKKDFYRYQKLRTMRENMHNIRIILFIPSVDQEALDKSLQQFDSEYGDIALRQPGVIAMKSAYIEVLREQIMQNKGFLPPESITGKVTKDPTDGKITQVEKGFAEEETKRRFMDRVRRGLVVTRDNDGNAVQLTEADFDERQLQGAYILATGMSLIDQRLISVASESNLAEDTGQYMSPYLQDVLKSNSLFRHLLVKFQIYRNQLAPLLYKPDEVLDKTLGFLKRWDPKKFHEIWERFNDNPLSIGQSVKEIFFIMKQNPFRSGDIWTYISWRANPKKEVESMLKIFVNKGEARMKARWGTHHAGAPAPDVYEAFMKLPAYSMPANTVPSRQIDVQERLKRQMEADWQTAHPGAPTVETYQKYVSEYTNWIGTGIRFEKLRGALGRFNLKDSVPEQIRRLTTERNSQRNTIFGSRTEETEFEAKERRNGAKRALEDLETARNLLRRTTELQPQRLYSKSSVIRKRINVALGYPEDAEIVATHRDVISKILDNLSMVELAWIKDRENILQAGRTFDHTSTNLALDTAFDIDQYIDPVVTDPDPAIQAQRRTEVRNFITAFENDWTNHEDDYIDEFVIKRDYRHGWVLWAEDAPVDEYNFTTLGTTAGFARKARDNDNLKKAGEKLIGLMGQMKKVREPEDLIEPMGKLWDDISQYDASKADAFITELTEGIDKTFMGDSRINIPIVGEFGKRMFKWSYARLVFDRSSPLWTSTTMRHLHALLRKDQQMSPGQQKFLNDHLPSSKGEVAWDVGWTMAELITLAVLFYMASKTLSEKKH